MNYGERVSKQRTVKDVGNFIFLGLRDKRPQGLKILHMSVISHLEKQPLLRILSICSLPYYTKIPPTVAEEKSRLSSL